MLDDLRRQAALLDLELVWNLPVRIRISTRSPLKPRAWNWPKEPVEHGCMSSRTVMCCRRKGKPGAGKFTPGSRGM